MTLLSVVNDVCAAVGVHTTPSVFADISNNRTMQEMLAVANEMADRIAADMRDWTTLRTSTVFVGNGLTEAFPLPVDYRRMLTNSHIWSSANTTAPMRFIPNTDEWAQRISANHTEGGGEWTIYGGQIHIRPAMAAGASARMSYLSKFSISLAAGGAGDRFMSDNDTYRLPERIFRLGMIWSWKQLKGSPYAEDMGTWSDAMANAMGYDSPSPIIIGRTPISANARIAYPWPLPT